MQGGPDPSDRSRPSIGRGPAAGQSNRAGRVPSHAVRSVASGSSGTPSMARADPPVVPISRAGTPASAARDSTAGACSGATATSTRPADSENSATNGSSGGNGEGDPAPP